MTMMKPHLQEAQSGWILLQQLAVQRHPLADELHYFLLGGEDVGGLLLVGALRELSLVGGCWLKSSTQAPVYQL